MHCVCKQKQIYFFPFGARITDILNIFKDEGSLAPEFDIETSSGVGYTSSEMVMSLICLLKMPAAACTISIQPRQGQGVSNLIYSSAISTPEAISAAPRIKSDMHSATVHDLSNVAHICDESQILHATAGILRTQISDITISDDEYLARVKSDM
jgi:hypothetical protein